MAAATVVMWAWLLAVVAAAADNTGTQSPSLSLLRHGGTLEIGKPQYILLEALKPEFSRNGVQEQDSRTSREFDVELSGEDMTGIAEPLSIAASTGKSAKNVEVQVPKERLALMLPMMHLPSPGLLEKARASNRVLRSASYQKRYAASSHHRKNSKENAHKRQKRYSFNYKLRSIAVPLSVFNFLGFLPVRVPGLPYHNDLPSPDYSRYDTKYDIYLPRYRRRKTFRRF